MTLLLIMVVLLLLKARRCTSGAGKNATRWEAGATVSYPLLEVKLVLGLVERCKEVMGLLNE